MSNPHSEMITDEASEVQVKNQRYIDWEEGAKAQRDSIIKLIQESYIPGKDAELLLKDIRELTP